MTPTQILDAAVAGLPKVVFEPRWNDPAISGKGTFTPKFVMLHHTAGTDSLGVLKNTAWKPVRGAHFLVDRDGTIHVLTSSVAYHAGTGGPRWGVAAGQMNHYAWGIEIEDLGKALTMTEAQITAAAALAGALLREMGSDLDCLIQHKEWNPSGKVDTRYSTPFWRDRVTATQTAQEVTQMATIPRKGSLSLDKWPVGERPMAKVGYPHWVTVPGGKWTTLAIFDEPAGGEFSHWLQVIAPKGADFGEVRLARLGWGSDSTGPGDVDATAQNALIPRSIFGWWREPISGHKISGGGPVAFQIKLPKGRDYRTRFVAKVERDS